MRLIAKHDEVGYVQPGQRPSCRNCKHLQASEENGFGQVTYWSCRLHKFEVRTGGICKDHPRALAEPAIASPNRGRSTPSLLIDQAAEFYGRQGRLTLDSAAGLTPVFCQAGVVAPPDSPGFGKTADLLRGVSA